MIKEIEVSILLPAYNAQKYIKRAINSILVQTLSNIEIIIVDDGSTDDTVKIIESLKDDRIKLYRNERNLGLIKTLNRGLLYCTGRYIARMDADDISHPNRLRHQITYLKKRPAVDILGTDVYTIDNFDKILGKPRPVFGNSLANALLPTGPSVLHPTIVFRSEILQDFFYPSEFSHCEDFALWLNLNIMGYKFSNLNKPLLYYRKHQDSVSASKCGIQEKNSIKALQGFTKKKFNKEITEDLCKLLLWSFKTDLNKSRFKELLLEQSKIFKSSELTSFLATTLFLRRKIGLLTLIKYTNFFYFFYFVTYWVRSYYRKNCFTLHTLVS